MHFVSCDVSRETAIKNEAASTTTIDTGSTRLPASLQSRLALTAVRGANDTGSPRSPSLHMCLTMNMWGLPRLQCARGNLYFCSSEPEPTESKGRLVIGTRLKASRGQGGSLNYLTVAPREEITLLTHPPCQPPTGNLWSLTAVRDLMGTSKVRRLCLGFGCWYPYYVPFVDSALETVGRGLECQTDLE